MKVELANTVGAKLCRTSTSLPKQITPTSLRTAITFTLASSTAFRTSAVPPMSHTTRRQTLGASATGKAFRRINGPRSARRWSCRPCQRGRLCMQQRLNIIWDILNKREKVVHEFVEGLHFNDVGVNLEVCGTLDEKRHSLERIASRSVEPKQSARISSLSTCIERLFESIHDGLVASAVTDDSETLPSASLVRQLRRRVSCCFNSSAVFFKRRDWKSPCSLTTIGRLPSRSTSSARWGLSRQLTTNCDVLPRT